MSEKTALTASSTVGEWLDGEVSGPLVRDLLAASGTPEAMLTPLRGLPLQQLSALSQGKLPQSVVDDLVRKVNA